jgi:hypothetical protein
MSGIDLTSLENLSTNIGSLLPSSGDIFKQAVEGAAVSVALKGLQAGGASSLDPLQIFHKDTVKPADNPNNIIGATATSAALANMAALDKANGTNTVGQFFANGGHVVG